MPKMKFPEASHIRRWGFFLEVSFFKYFSTITLKKWLKIPLVLILGEQELRHTSKDWALKRTVFQKTLLMGVARLPLHCLTIIAGFGTTRAEVGAEAACPVSLVLQPQAWTVNIFTVHWSDIDFQLIPPRQKVSLGVFPSPTSCSGKGFLE